VTIAAVSPAAGATLVIPERYPYFIPGGAILPPDSALLSARVTMTLSQVYRLPCDVIGLRAILHTRNSGTLTSP
jgi:hypothetical protein